MIEKTENTEKMKEFTVFLHEVPVQVEISKYTTCDDVIEMVLYSTKDKADGHKYGLFESVHGIEKLTTGKSLITKVIRSYGADVQSLTLNIRKMDDFSNKKLPALSKAKTKLAKLLAGKSKKTPFVDTSDEIIVNNLACKTAGNKDGIYEKKINMTNTSGSTEDSKIGKLALMKRYLSDVATRAPDNIPDAMDYAFDGRDDTDESLDLDTAFVEEYEDVANLNKCVIYDDDNESAFHDTLSQYSEGPVRTVEGCYETKTKSIDKLIHILDTAVDRDESHDKILESFMNTRLHCSACCTEDEGLSSMGSDDACSI